MLSNKEIGRRIYDLRIQRNLTLDEIASKVGVAKSTIQRYEKGNITKIKLPVIESIAYVLRVNPNWLIGNVDDPSLSGALPDNIIPMPKMNTVPLIGTIACGDPILAAENIEAEVSMPEHVVADFALRCKGDSMIVPTSLSSIRKTRSMSPLSISARRSAPSASWASPWRLRAM